MTTTHKQFQGCAVSEALERNRIQEHKAPTSLKESVVQGSDALEGFYTPLQSLPFFRDAQGKMHPVPQLRAHL